jgi:DNA-binding transcriptional MerR regulator
VSSRTYLSIGDVLTLLREEFPDVTISKIRFLESQGLVNPERSPSGYRKFFEHDVERLRWVLRQQREHFLPLKVIRDRLAEGDLSEPEPGTATAADPTAAPSAAVSQSNGRVSEPAHAAVGAAAPRHAAANGDAGPVGPGRREEELTKADSEAMARILADASRRTARLPDAPARPAEPAATAAPVEVTTPAAAVHQADATAPAPRTAAASPPAASTAGQAAGPSAGRGTRGQGTDAAPRPSATATAAAAGAAASSGRGAHEAKATTKEPTKPSAPGRGGHAGSAPGAAATASAAMVTGASMTSEELCGASGLSEIELANLEGFGLVESVQVAGMATYDEDALTVANLAAELRVFGIEPRHLRLYKNAVDREVGLIEQVIIPLLRQRNPESRQRAIESAERLGTLGQTMRATLLRASLRRHIGG